MASSPIDSLSQRVVYITFCHSIDEKQACFLMQLCSEIVSKEHPDILYLILSSTGGSVDYGITLYNFLRALPCILVTHNIGTIESIANIVFLAGEQRLAAKRARFLLHGIFWHPAASTIIANAQISELRSRFCDDEDNIKSIIMERTALKEDQIRDFFLTGESRSPEFAKEVGIISSIDELKIQRGRTLIISNPA